MADFVTEILSLGEKVTEIEQAIAKLIKSVDAGITELAKVITISPDGKVHLKVHPEWKTKVISVPIAIRQLQESVEDVVKDVKDRFNKFKELIDLFKAQVAALESGASGYAGRPIGGLGKAGLDILIASLVVSLVGDLAKTFDQVADFSDLFTKIIHKIDTLEDVFLSQASKRTKSTETYYKRNA